MIGSLPHAEARDALALLNKYPLSLPAWPQLPRRSYQEDMCVQYGGFLPGLQIDLDQRRAWVEQDDQLPEEMAEFYEQALGQSLEAFAVPVENAAGLYAFIEDLAGRGTRLPFVKGQVVGPVTAGLSLADQNCKPLWFDEQYRDVLMRNMARTGVWMAQTLGQFAEKTIIFFDEPIFAALGTPAYMGISDDDITACYTEVFQELRNAGALCGIHCCGNMDWSLLARTPVDIISFDAYSYTDKVALYGEAIAGFLARGGRLAWGMVPTGSPDLVVKESADSLMHRIDDGVSLFVGKGISEDTVRTSMILTPSCGMGTLPVDAAEKVLQTLDQLGKKLGG